MQVREEYRECLGKYLNGMHSADWGMDGDASIHMNTPCMCTNSKRIVLSKNVYICSHFVMLNKNKPQQS